MTLGWLAEVDFGIYFIGCFTHQPGDCGVVFPAAAEPFQFSWLDSFGMVHAWSEVRSAVHDMADDGTSQGVAGGVRVPLLTFSALHFCTIHVELRAVKTTGVAMANQLKGWQS